MITAWIRRRRRCSWGIATRRSCRRISARTSGRRIFFLIERHRLEALRALLPAENRQSLHVVDESNNKVYLAVAQL